MLNKSIELSNDETLLMGGTDIATSIYRGFACPLLVFGQSISLDYWGVFFFQTVFVTSLPFPGGGTPVAQEEMHCRLSGSPSHHKVSPSASARAQLFTEKFKIP